MQLFTSTDHILNPWIQEEELNDPEDFQVSWRYRGYWWEQAREEYEQMEIISRGILTRFRIWS